MPSWTRTLLVAALLAVGGLPAPALLSPLQAAETADLKTRLEKDLEARLPSEFAFINLVLARVEQDVLPRSLVNKAYLWARRKPRFKMQYFERAMRVLAKREGIDL